jgi:hypothetical protein
MTFGISLFTPILQSMKHLSFPGILLFIISILPQTGCQWLIEEKVKEALYMKARTLEGTARFYLKEGEVDSALSCYPFSAALKKNRFAERIHYIAAISPLYWVLWAGCMIHCTSMTPELHTN